MVQGTSERSELHALVTSEEIGKWRQPRPLELVVDLTGPWIQIGAAIAVSALVPHPAVLVLAFFVIAGALHGVNCVTHEFATGWCFPAAPG